MFVILVCVVIFFLILVSIKRYRKEPPGPYGLPIVGYYPFLGKDPNETIYRLSKNYSDIMSINFLGESFWVLNSSEAVKEAFVTKGDIFAARPATEYGLFNIFIKDTVGISEGDEWKARMKFILGHLAELGMGKSEFEVTIHNILDDGDRYIDSKAGKPHDYSDLLHNFTTNVIAEMVFGKRYDVSDHTSLQINNWMRNMLSTLEYMNMLITGNIVKLLMSYKSHYPTTLTRNLDEFNHFVSGLVDERRKTFDANNCRYFVDYWLKENSGPNGKYFKIEDLSKQICQFFLGNTTPASILYHLLHTVASNPNIQQRVFEEIENTIGAERDFCYLEKDRLPYTQAVISETLRFLSLAPLGNVHVNRVPTELMGFDAPMRQKVIANLYALSRDPKHFCNPNEFDPNNFLDKNGYFKPNPASIPFGVGVRKCVASKLAEVEISLAFVHLIQKFGWTFANSDEFGSPVYTQGNIRFLQPYKVCAKRRK